MGKALIIHGADFSQNAIERVVEKWYWTRGSEQIDLITPENVLFADRYDYVIIDNGETLNKPINSIRLLKAQGKNIIISKMTITSVEEGSTVSVQQLGTFTPSSQDEVVTIPETILSQGEFIAIQGFAFATNVSPDEIHFIASVADTISYNRTDNHAWGYDIGYIGT